MDEREDGEISEGTGDSFDVAYKPVLRPDASQYRCVPRPLGSSDEDYSSDSDSDMTAVKRKRPNVSKMDTCPSESSQQKGWPPDSVEAVRSFAKPRRQNNIWSTVMEEQVLSQEIGGFGLKRRLDQGDRSVESYDYTQARKLRGLQEEESDEEGEIVEDEDIKKKRLSRKRHVKGREYVNNAEEHDQQTREISDVVVTDEMTDEDVGVALAEALHEHKPDIIVRVIEVLGREKSLELFKDTQEVERNGGLLILDGSRRRTSGGVFLQLLKKLPGVEKSDLNKIFVQDVEWRKRKRAHRRRERHESKPQVCVEDGHCGLKRFSFEKSRRNSGCGGSERTHANQNFKSERMERKKVYTWEDFSRMILEEPNALDLLPSLPHSPRTMRMIYPHPRSISCHHQ